MTPPRWLDPATDPDDELKPIPDVRSDLRPQEVRVVVRKDRSLERSIALVSLVVYLAAAVWMRAGLGYSIGDSLARSANARAMVSSRFPGLAPVGFVWMPLPTLIQVPFVIVLSPFHLAAYSGPFSSAFCGALTAYLLVRSCQTWGLSSKLTAALVLCYSLNPIVIFHQANGMSEGVYFLCLALLLHGFLGWTSKATNQSLLTMAVALSAATIVRYETLVFIPIVALGVALQSRDRSWTNVMRGVRSGFVVALPSLYAFFLWLLASRLIVGDAFYWRKKLTAQLGTPKGSIWIPDERNWVTGFFYISRWSMLLAPGLIVLVPLLFGRRKKLVVGSNWISLFAVFFPGLLLYLFAHNETSAAARYFAPLLIFPTVISISLLARRKNDPAPFGRYWWFAQTAVLLMAMAGTVTGSLAFTDQRATAIENEFSVFRPGFGKTFTSNDAVDTTVRLWQRSTAAIDAELSSRPGSIVAIDMASAFRTFGFTRYPGRFVIDADKDYERLLAAGADLRGVDFVFLKGGDKSSALWVAVDRMSPAVWEVPIDVPNGTLYKRKIATIG